MYRKNQMLKTSISVNTSYEGESIEQKMRRITQNKEPITDGAPLIYTERKNGVDPAYDIRTDRFELAVEKMDVVHRTNLARREERLKQMNKDLNKKDDGKAAGNNDGGAEPTQTT